MKNVERVRAAELILKQISNDIDMGGYNGPIIDMCEIMSENLPENIQDEMNDIFFGLEVVKNNLKIFFDDDLRSEMISELELLKANNFTVEV